MRHWRAIVLMGVGVLAFPVPAAAQDQSDFCGELGRLIAAAHERTPFATVAQSLSAGDSVIPGYPAANCEVRAGEGLLCETSDMGRRIYAT